MEVVGAMCSIDVLCCSGGYVLLARCREVAEGEEGAIAMRVVPTRSSVTGMIGNVCRPNFQDP